MSFFMDTHERGVTTAYFSGSRSGEVADSNRCSCLNVQGSFPRGNETGYPVLALNPQGVPCIVGCPYARRISSGHLVLGTVGVKRDKLSYDRAPVTTWRPETITFPLFSWACVVAEDTHRSCRCR